MFSRMLEFFLSAVWEFLHCPLISADYTSWKSSISAIKKYLGTQKILVWSYVPRILENIMAKFDTNYIIFRNVEIFKNYFFQIKKIL
jgi:hypothetical protein